MNKWEFRELLAKGREQRAVEFKGPGSRKDNKHLVAKVVRAALSMSNRRDGGLVIIGVEEDNEGHLVPTGLSAEDLASWKYDDLADTFAEYADPSIPFDIESIVLDGKTFTVIRVKEFVDVPILCKKEYPNVLRKGACYVRTRRKPETAEIPTQEDMRDLLDLAVEKGVRRFVSQAYEAGLVLSGQSQPTNSDMFDHQLGDLLEG